MEGQSNTAKWVWGVIILVVIVVGGWWVYSKHGSPANGTGPIVIGVIGPFTGDAAVYGEPLQKTLQLAADQTNAAGGVDGRQVELVFQDGKCDSTDAVNAANLLINTDHVQAIIGGFCSGETIPVVPIAAAAKVFVFSPSASSPTLTGISPFFARDYPSDNKQADVLSALAAQKGYKNIAFIQEQTDYAQGLYQAFNTDFTKIGDTTENQQFPSSATDFRSALVTLKAANPDALFIDVQTPAAGDRILQQLHELGWAPQLFVSDTVMGDPATLTKDESLLQGAYGAQFVPDASSTQMEQFVNAYQAKYGPLSYTGYMACAYDDFNLLMQGIAKVGYNGQALATWSRTISNYQGASGVITIDQNGDRESGHSPQQIENGQTVNLPQ
jgi:branched-chain amino acid transport system substrate-binding protein